MTVANGDLLDVLVVGAGPTGLTLAAQLQGFGATVRIVDRQLDRVQESRALGVQPRTLEVLRGLGLANELIGRGNDAVWAQLHAGGRVVGIRLFGLGLDDSAYPFLLLVSQAETEQVLGDHLAGGGVWSSGGGAGRLRCRPRRRGLCSSPSRRAVRAGTRPLCGRLRRRQKHRAPRRRDRVPGRRLPPDLRPGRSGGRAAGPRRRPRLPGRGGHRVVLPLGRPASWRMLAMHPSLQGRREPAQPSLEELQALADAMTRRGAAARPGLADLFRAPAPPPATGTGGCSWPGMPPMFTVPPAPRA